MPPKVRTTPRNAPRQDRSRQTIDVILEATARVLVADGYDRASTNRIAEVAGVSVGALYRYFPCKEALVAELCERHIASMLALCEGKILELGDVPLPIAARELVDAILAAHAVAPKLHRILVEQVPRVGKLRQVDAMQERIGVLVRAYLEARKEHLRPHNLDLAVFVLVHAVEAVAHAALKGPFHVKDDALAAELATMIVSFLVGPQQAR